MMRAPFTQLYLHLVWATWDRLPLVVPAIEPRLYATIAEKCRELKCVPLAIGGVADHVHLLVRMPTTVAVATLAKEVKGASSHLVTHVLMPDQPFKWQGSYGAFTLRKADVPTVRVYIESQKQHHASPTSGMSGSRPPPRTTKATAESPSSFAPIQSAKADFAAVAAVSNRREA